MKIGIIILMVLFSLKVACEGEKGADGETGIGEPGPTGETGIQGPAGVGATGPTGLQGLLGENGVTGVNGQSGANGQNGACWDSITPQIDSVTYNRTMYAGNPYTIIINYNSSLHSVNNLEFGLVTQYGYASQGAFPDHHNQFAFTPVQSGGPLTFTAVASDNCQQNFFSFTVDLIFPLADYDGNEYRIVKINGQLWMAENLKVTHYNNGVEIPYVTDNTAWGNLTTGAYCNYGNSDTNGSIYGRLYNWYAVNDSRKICPTGWHVPSVGEWTALKDYLGGITVAGGKMKETGTLEAGTGLWYDPNTGATNESGFSGLPGGWRSSIGQFFSIGYDAFWWSATEGTATHAWSSSLVNSSLLLFIDSDAKAYGYSVRCVRD